MFWPHTLFWVTLSMSLSPSITLALVTKFVSVPLLISPFSGEGREPHNLGAKWHCPFCLWWNHPPSHTLKFKWNHGPRCFLQNQATVTRREILLTGRESPERYPRGSLRQVHKELQTKSGARGRRARCFCARDPGRGGKGHRRDPEARAAEEGRSCPTRQPAPASPNHPAALPEASLAPPRPQRAGRLHRAGWHLGTPAPGGRERRRGDRGALRAPARDAPTRRAWPKGPPGGRTSDVGALALVQLAGGRGAHGGGARGCCSVAMARPAPRAALTAAVRARSSLLEADALGTRALQLKGPLPPRGAAFWAPPPGPRPLGAVGWAPAAFPPALLSRAPRGCLVWKDFPLLLFASFCFLMSWI